MVAFVALAWITPYYTVPYLDELEVITMRAARASERFQSIFTESLIERPIGRVILNQLLASIAGLSGF